MQVHYLGGVHSENERKDVDCPEVWTLELANELKRGVERIKQDG